MDLFEAIVNRRSVGRVADQPVEREKIERLLELAAWAPNHHYTEPWKFFVLTGEGRQPLADTLAEIALESLSEEASETEREKVAQSARSKPYRAPVIITAAVVPQEGAKIFEIEEIAAVSAAIQNMLLAAHALGLAAVWRSGAPAYHPKMNALFGLGDRDKVMGFIYLGYPVIDPPRGRRTDVALKTVWVDQPSDLQG